MDRFVVTEAEHNERLDSFVAKRFCKFSRVKIQRAIAAHEILVDGSFAKSSTRLKQGQSITVGNLKPESDAPIPEPIELSILYEDDWLIAINKPPAMVVHPARGHWSGTLTAALAYHFQNLSAVGGPARPGIVHRLDRDTSGVILVAKTDEAHLKLAAQFENRSVQKEYFAIVTPVPDRDQDVIDKPIGSHPYQREKKAIRENHASSRAAKSVYEVIERFDGFAAIRVKPKTGRTHQIRVHMAHVGTPVLCDALYSGRSRLTTRDLNLRCEQESILLDRQALHARRIQIQHPETGRILEIAADLPNDIQETLAAIRTQRGLDLDANSVKRRTRST
jgi:23S rRNA pseudouridine1911/1915/1917 synthase